MGKGIYKHKSTQGFKKGYVPHNKGKKMSEESRLNLSNSLKGRVVSEKTRIKIGDSNRGVKNGMFGKKASEETRIKISVALKGKSRNKGYKWSKESLEKRTKSQSKEKHYNWKGGITPVNIKIRNSVEYRLWRLAVFGRDRYTCVWCGQVGGKLNADHIKPFAYYPELRFAIDNGRTLCIACHKKTETYGTKARKTM